MISVEQALALILAPLPRVAAEIVALDRACDRVLAEDILARRTQPPAPMSAMDGWAMRHADLTQPLTIVGESSAGRPYRGVVGKGQVVRIFTGAVMPEGADCVILQEDARIEEGQFHFLEAPLPGKHIRPRGLDFSQGGLVLRAGRVLTPRDIALLAAADHPWVAVRRRPRVAVLATGDELARPGEPVREGGIIASNHLGIAALVRRAGGDPIDLGIAADEVGDLRHLSQGARGADLLVTIGGASVGDYDLVRAGLEQQGLAIAFHKIAMRPGKPLMSGRLGQTAFLGLPGNPVSAMICGLLFLVPALRHMLGLPTDLPTIPAISATPLRANDRRADFLRARLSTDMQGRITAEAIALQDSSVLSVLAEAEGLILRPPLAPALAAGDPVRVMPLDPWI